MRKDIAKVAMTAVDFAMLAMKAVDNRDWEMTRTFTQLSMAQSLIAITSLLSDQNDDLREHVGGSLTDIRDVLAEMVEHDGLR